LFFGQCPGMCAAVGIAIGHASQADARDFHSRSAQSCVIHIGPFPAVPRWTCELPMITRGRTGSGPRRRSFGGLRPARASRYHRLPMKQAVFRERNKQYYRVLHAPIWIWVFWVLPGYPLTYDLYAHGPDRWHWIWLAMVVAGIAWRGWKARIPGCEQRPYITHYGVHQPNLPYRVVCYTAAWVDLIVPYALNLIGLIVASVNGHWLLKEVYQYGYFPLALAVVLATVFDWTPRARRDTF